MSMSSLETLSSLMKALEAGGYNAAPSTLVQGAALQVEDLSPVMHNVTFDDQHVKLQKALKVESCKSLLAQFDRQLSYGIFGGSAQWEGAIGQEETSDFVRIVVPMSFYAHTRRVTTVAEMVATVDGVKASERCAKDAAIKLMADVEFDLFRGKADFSNAGVFDGAPTSIAEIPNVLGLDAQVRQSDAQRNAKDLMLGEYGSDATVVVPCGGALTQPVVEDSSVRSAMNLGSADKLYIDPISLSAYNKIAFDMQRIMLAGSAQDATGADLRRQWVSGGTVSIEASRFLSAKTRPASPRQHANAPGAPTISIADTNAASTSLVAGDYRVYVTAVNEIGESVKSATSTATCVAGDRINVQIALSTGTVRYYNVYRSTVNASTDASCKLVGRVAYDGAAHLHFLDLGNKLPGGITGFLVQGDTMGVKELCPYSRVKLAVTDLSQTECHFRFLSLAVFQPRKNVMVDNIQG